jgi:DNA polymerase-3 subunit delta
MTSSDFLRALKKQGPAPVYLFVGAEAYERGRCRRALVAAVLPDEDEREQGLTPLDLAETTISAVLDDAQSLSLFAPRRLIWVSGAEAALPRGRAAAAAEPDEEESGSKSDPGAIAAYVRNPAPDVVVVFDSSRYEFEGEDRARNERVQKFFAAIPNQVEFRPFTPEEARGLAAELARERGLKIGPAELGLLVQAMAGDAARISSEIDKLALYAGTDRKITAADLAALVPNAQDATIFALAAALGSGNRTRSLEALDSLVRDGEYLPLALNFLETQLRLALVAYEANLKSAYDIQQQLTRMGIRIWRDRAEQVRQTLSAFPKDKLELAIRKTYDADRALRDTRPDDRTVMEELILALTK